MHVEVWDGNHAECRAMGMHGMCMGVCMGCHGGVHGGAMGWMPWDAMGAMRRDAQTRTAHAVLMLHRKREQKTPT